MGQYFTNDNSIPSKLVKTRAVVLNNSFIFYTDNGVFSKDGLDFGSRLLLENIPLTEIGESLLDVGCGYGVFGIVLNKILGVKVTMCDVNRRALHLAEKILKKINVAIVQLLKVIVIKILILNIPLLLLIHQLGMVKK